MRVAKDCKALFKAQLEPIPTGDAVTRPVVKIFVSDDRLDVLKRRIGGSRRVGKYRGGIKNIEALILHRPHIKVIDRNDHENIQVVLASIDFFVPAHRLLKRCHRMRAFIGIFVLDKYLQRHGASTAGHKTVLDHA